MPSFFSFCVDGLLTADDAAVEIFLYSSMTLLKKALSEFSQLLPSNVPIPLESIFCSFLQFELTVIVSFHVVKPLSFYTKYKYIP